MNINSNELLLLDKKIRFGEEPAQQTAPAAIAAPETSAPQTGMNALMFHGLKNVASNPQLASELKMLNDIEPAQAEDASAKEYTVPFQSNIAFQGKASKFKNIAVAALLGMAAMAGVTSCNDKEEFRMPDITNENNTIVNVDLSALMELIEELKGLRQDLADRDEQLAAKYDQLISMFNQVITLMQEQKLSNDSFQALVLANQKLIIDLMVAQGADREEAMAKLDAILEAVQDGSMKIQEALEQIKNLVNEINNKLSTLINEFQTFHNEYKEDKKTELDYLKQIIKNDEIQTDILVDMSKTQSEMAENINNIKNTTNVLLEYTQDDSKFEQLIEAIKNIQGGGNSGSVDIDYKQLEEMFKAMGVTIAEAINMSASQLEEVIKNFQNTYIETEAAQTEQFASIIAKLDDLKHFNGLNKDEIIEAIKNISINGGGTASPELGEKLDEIIDALNRLQATLNAMYEKIGDLAAKVENSFEKWDAKFDAILDALEGFDGQLSTIIDNQKNAEIYLDNLLKEVENLKEEIKNIQIAGGNIDYEKLEEMWQKHDEANFEKYSELIKELGIDTGDLKNIEDLLASIDAKMDNIKDNSDILNQILDKLNGIDWSHPDYNAKLDEIIELLKNFKCNCNGSCGGNNEGIVGDLEDILG